MPPPDKPRDDALCGILVVDKPSGLSSMRIVSIVRRRAGGVKTGHAGTLDPLATGVLVLALGRATKSIDRLMATEKQYTTVIDLSAFTATDDSEAEPEPVPVERPDEATVQAALGRFRGTFLQRPPAFSAVKIGGRRSYKLARKGAKPEPEPRPVTVHEIELVRYAWPELEVHVRSAKGFYVRSLARELGRALGTGGYCRSIRRTAVGPFTLAEAVALDDLPEVITSDDLREVDSVAL